MALKIVVTTGTGEGPSTMAAYDAALRNAGIWNYNLIYLSSMIPAGSTVERARFVSHSEDYGNRLYVVMARQEATEEGQEAWAALGWAQDEAGRGIFAEQFGRYKPRVQRELFASLETMIAARPAKFGAIQHEMTGITSQGRPVCAVVAAIFKSEGWE